MSAGVASQFTERYASAINSVAHGPAMCTPRIGPPLRAETIFTMPSVDRDALVLEADSLAARLAADADDDLIDDESLVAGLAVEPYGDVGSPVLELRDAHARQHLDAALGERAHDRLRDLLVDAGQN